ncbi:MAG: hypothetical protein WAO10_13180, partial [Candidatus Sulfotelmatobacter sp.]
MASAAASYPLATREKRGLPNRFFFCGNLIGRIRGRAGHKEGQCSGWCLIECIILLFCGGLELQRRQRYIAFWSYTRFDDRNDGKWLTGLKEALTAEVQALRGVSVEIFQDVEGIGWGEPWMSKIKLAEDDALFLIPIITPSYFNSE